MTMSIDITEEQVADAIWRSELSVTSIMRHLARARAYDGDESSLLVEFADIGKALSGAKISPAAMAFGGELSRVANQFHEQLLKEERA
ncbi:hypothetical protein [Salipiger thiooxidans]|uniref:hypothetical protein n=1 Tax=Salipiger thiooxidans TaxID=282683 RepID=UPI001CF956A4|nr:hypothetical protein [Salipiger thiooxidans]